MGQYSTNEVNNADTFQRIWTEVQTEEEALYKLVIIITIIIIIIIIIIINVVKLTVPIL